MASGDLQAQVGSPAAKWDALKTRVQGEAIQRFSDAQGAWLDLMWTLDAYRIAQVLPIGFQDFGAVNRGKGNWFAELLSLLLHNRTHHRIASRQQVRGFSQRHQIDIAWPARGEDPLVCCESKVTGAPAFGNTPARSALADFSNRRKELKFAATDLKLYRRQQGTRIEHWDVWRERQPPKSYFLWAARLDRKRDRIETLVREARLLIDTYLDGAGLFAWQVDADNSAYEPVALPESERVTSLDDVLYRIASEVNAQVDAKGQPPPPVRPEQTSIDSRELPRDPDDAGGPEGA